MQANWLFEEYEAANSLKDTESQTPWRAQSPKHIEEYSASDSLRSTSSIKFEKLWHLLLYSDMVLFYLTAWKAEYILWK